MFAIVSSFNIVRPNCVQYRAVDCCVKNFSASRSSIIVPDSFPVLNDIYDVRAIATEIAYTQNYCKINR